MKECAIGVDIGGTSYKLGLVDRRGRVLARSSFLTKGLDGRRAQMPVLADHVGRLRGVAVRKKMKLIGVGIGAPGPIDVERGFVYFFPNLPGWKDTPMKALLRKKLGLPVFIDNDANAMALGESLFGAGKGAASVIALTLGTGIGGGLVLGGRLFHGYRFSAAEIGHLVINENGPRCACGNRGCVEAYVGNGYLVREVRSRLKAGAKSVLNRWLGKEKMELTPLLLSRAAEKGDAFSKNIWREAGEHLGTALAGLVNILNPEKIILGGGIAQNCLLFKPVIATLRKKAFPIAARSVKVVPAKLGVDAGLVGAAALVFARYRTPSRN